MIDFQAISDCIVKHCELYEKTAPIVSRWLDELFIRLEDSNVSIKLVEIQFLMKLEEDGISLDGQQATNRLYHLQERLGENVDGQIGH